MRTFRSLPGVTVRRSLGFLSISFALLAAAAPNSAGSSLSSGTLLLPAGALARTTPDPPNVEVHPCDELGGVLLAPDRPEPLPATQVVIIVRNSDNQPVPNAQVVLELTPGNVLCDDMVTTAMTDGGGVAHMKMAGGGCVQHSALAGVLKANGVTIRAYQDVKSPDQDGSGGDLRVDLSDLVAFSSEFLGASPDGCHDYDNGGSTDLGDLIIFSAAFAGALACP